MQAINIFKDEVPGHYSRYNLSFQDDKGRTTTFEDLPDEIKDTVLTLVAWCDDQKSDEEKALESVEQQQMVAFNFIKATASDEEKMTLIDTYPEYELSKDYFKDDEFKHDGKIYRVLTDHTSAQHWSVTDSPSLYVDIMHKATLQEWKQPTGSHDAYMIGDEVLFKGKHYISIIDSNTWSPTDYPQGWQEIGG